MFRIFMFAVIRRRDAVSTVRRRVLLDDVAVRGARSYGNLIRISIERGRIWRQLPNSNASVFAVGRFGRRRRNSYRGDSGGIRLTVRRGSACGTRWRWRAGGVGGDVLRSICPHSYLLGSGCHPPAHEEIGYDECGQLKFLVFRCHLVVAREKNDLVSLPRGDGRVDGWYVAIVVTACGIFVRMGYYEERNAHSRREFWLCEMSARCLQDELYWNNTQQCETIPAFRVDLTLDLGFGGFLGVPNINHDESLVGLVESGDEAIQTVSSFPIIGSRPGECVQKGVLAVEYIHPQSARRRRRREVIMNRLAELACS